MYVRFLGALISIVMLTAAFTQANCIFGPNRYYGVMSHRANRVFITHDRWYYVGKLPEGWQDLKTGARTASWYNPEFLSTISTDVLCEMSTGDRPLESVAGDIVAAIDDRTVTDSQEFSLDGRGALRETVSGSVDGVPLMMEAVVLKKNNCSFNMAVIAPPEEMPNVRPIFDEFVHGFHYEF